jgi:hypothetical protein
MNIAKGKLRRSWQSQFDAAPLGSIVRGTFFHRNAEKHFVLPAQLDSRFHLMIPEIRTALGHRESVGSQVRENRGSTFL